MPAQPRSHAPPARGFLNQLEPFPHEFPQEHTLRSLRDRMAQLREVAEGIERELNLK